jgi:hypothetical protein
VGFDEGVGIRFVCGDIDGGGVHVVEVDRSDDVLGDAGGKGDGDPVAFAVFGVPAALPAQVGGVGEVAPRLVFELLPPPEEVVAVVVADFGDVGIGISSVSGGAGLRAAAYTTHR